MQSIRKIGANEIEIIEYFIKIGCLKLASSWSQTALIQLIDDGGMGSFKIFENDSEIKNDRKFGKQIAEYNFVDDDNVVVIVSLNLDQSNKLFEVDIWKTDYSPVIKIKFPS